MKFKTPCFVRVEDAEKRIELVQWCQSVGYYFPDVPRAERDGNLVMCDEHCVGTGYVYELFSTGMPIDCGIDIELFKALAAMNDENDREQWFVCIKQPAIWRFCLPKAGDMVPHNTANAQFIDCENFRKATAEEIVEHFKNR